MSKKKIIFDLAFIVIATVILIALNESGLIEKYIGFALIPILMSYYIGQFVEKKTRSSETHN